MEQNNKQLRITIETLDEQDNYIVKETIETNACFLTTIDEDCKIGNKIQGSSITMGVGSEILQFALLLCAKKSAQKELRKLWSSRSDDEVTEA